MTETTQAKPRKPVLALVANFGAPGLGQLYNGDWRRALLVYLVSLGSFPIISTTQLVLSFSGLLGLLLIALGFLAWISVDAWSGAKKSLTFRPKAWNRWYVYLGIVLVHVLIMIPIAEHLFPRPAKAFKVPSGTMSPSIHIGDHIIVDVTAYRRARPQRGDVAFFLYPRDPSKAFIKRVIGLPGESIEVKGRTIFVDGRPLSEPWTVLYETETGSRLDRFGPTKLSDGEYFMLGDNRDKSYDSRFRGSVPVSHLRGKALYIYWATDKSRIGHKFQ